MPVRFDLKTNTGVAYPCLNKAWKLTRLPVVLSERKQILPHPYGTVKLKTITELVRYQSSGLGFRVFFCVSTTFAARCNKTSVLRLRVSRASVWVVGIYTGTRVSFMFVR